MEGESYDEGTRELFAGMSEQLQGAILEVVVRALSSMGIEEPEPEMVEELTLMCCREMFEDFMARVSEFLSDEVMERYVAEETLRLSSEYPEGVPRDVLATACERRAREEYPQAFKLPGRKREWIAPNKGNVS
jgi:hypothetical protein